MKNLKKKLMYYIKIVIMFSIIFLFIYEGIDTNQNVKPKLTYRDTVMITEYLVGILLIPGIIYFINKLKIFNMKNK